MAPMIWTVITVMSASGETLKKRLVSYCFLRFAIDNAAVASLYAFLYTSDREHYLSAAIPSAQSR